MTDDETAVTAAPGAADHTTTTTLSTTTLTTTNDSPVTDAGSTEPPDGAETTAPPARPRSRRRAASRPAGPPQPTETAAEPDAAGADAQGPSTPDTAAPPLAEAAADSGADPAPAKPKVTTARTRTRRTKAASTPEPTTEPTDEAAEPAQTSAAELTAATADRADTGVTAEAGQPSDAAAAADLGEVASESPVETSPRRRTRRAAVRPSAPPDEPAELSAVAAPATTSEPSADDSVDAVADATLDAPAQPAPAPAQVLTSPPIVVFQPPATAGVDLPARGTAADLGDDDVEVADGLVSPKRGDSAKATIDADDGAGSGQAAPDAGPQAEGTDDEEESGTRRRRRRGGRGRRRRSADDTESAQDTADGAAADSAVEPAETPAADEPVEAKPTRRGRAAKSVADSGPATAAAAAPAGLPAGEVDATPTAADEPADGAEGAGAADGEGDETTASRRRRRRRRREDDTGAPRPDDPPDTVVKVRPSRRSREREAEADGDEVTALRGSTRLEAKKQRRREGRDSGRRRPAVVSESEFLARREAVERVMVVRQSDGRTQIAVLEDGVLVEHYVSRGSQQSMIGSVYLGKVQNVLPSMEAAFVDIGRGRNAVLYAGEVDWDGLGGSGSPRRIEEALKSGQSVLVQVTKDSVGHKGARLTSQISLPGRYLVYVPRGSMSGISRKLPDTERSRLKGVLRDVVPEDAGVIVRTAAEGATEEELTRDVARLRAQWEDISVKSGSSTAPALLYSEPDLTIKVVRDLYNEDFAKLVVAGDEAWDTIEAYVSHVAPTLAERLERWTEAGDVFADYRVDEQIAKALDRKVWLPSGGSLVIDRTEAMTVVDVNTGKFTGQGGNLEETVTRNNLEAAEEMVRQLRLRDIGGIIVVDFIDMVLESNRDLVLRRLVECLGRDRTKHQVAEVTSLGLVQMTRKRIGTGLLEAFSEPCESCGGRGVRVRMDSPAVTESTAPADGPLDTPAVPTPRRRRRSAGNDEPTPAALAAAPTPQPV